MRRKNTEEGKDLKEKQSVSRNQSNHSYPDPALWLERGASEMKENKYGIKYMERELKKLERKQQRTYTFFYKPAPPHSPSSPPTSYFSAKYHLKALKSPSANEITRKKAMGAFHSWYKSEVEVMLHHIKDLETYLGDLSGLHPFGAEVKAISCTIKLTIQFRTFQATQSQLPLNPRYLFLHYASHLVPKVHLRVMYVVFEMMYGIEKAYKLAYVDSKRKRKVALREVFRVSQCLKEILCDTRLAMPSGIHTTLGLMYVERKLRKLSHLVEEAVTTMENSREIFDILSWMEDISWSITMKENITHMLSKLLVDDDENAEITGSANGSVLHQDTTIIPEMKEKDLEEGLKETLLSWCAPQLVPHGVLHISRKGSDGEGELEEEECQNEEKNEREHEGDEDAT